MQENRIVLKLCSGVRCSQYEESDIVRTECPEGWLDASFVGMGCLLFHSENMSWVDGAVFCGANNSHLLEIEQQYELDFVVAALEFLETETGTEDYWWTGGTDVHSEGTWYWTNSFKPVQEFVWSGTPTPGPYYNYLCLSYVNGYKGASCLSDTSIQDLVPFLSIPKPICQLK